MKEIRIGAGATDVTETRKLASGLITGPPADDSGQEHGFAGKSILLVDDMEINRVIVMALLEETLVQVDCAENGMIAVEMFIANPGKYDMILMDINMPEMDGIEATHQIRGLGMTEGEKVPILALTASLHREEVDNYLAAGMNDHISKPVDAATLRQKLHLYLLPG